MPKDGLQQAIGGYFELELPGGNSFYHDDALLYQSARGAFRALLKVEQPKRVLVPAFVCDSMLSPLIDEGIEYLWYDLDESLDVPDSINLNNNDLLLYVNYYGVCQAQVEHLIERYPPKQIVLDFSQAFFDPPRHQVLATIYSPRKFFGVPDGGMLITKAEVDSPMDADTGSINRMTHLLKRLYEQPEISYPDYLQAEKSLEDSTPKTMSGLTKRLLESVDYKHAQEKRKENFSYFHSRLGLINEFLVDESRLEAPLCYPLITNIKGLRHYLIQNRIFVPTYWQDASERVSRSWNEKMIEGLLPIPLDQRYGKQDLKRIVTLISGKRQ